MTIEELKTALEATGSAISETDADLKNGEVRLSALESELVKLLEAMRARVKEKDEQTKEIERLQKQKRHLGAEKRVGFLLKTIVLL